MEEDDFNTEDDDDDDGEVGQDGDARVTRPDAVPVLVSLVPLALFLFPKGAVAVAHATYTVFTFTNSRMPKIPSSRPWPDSLMPGYSPALS